MEVPAGARQVRRGNEIQKPCRGRIDGCNLQRTKIPASLRQRRHSGKHVVGIRAARSAVVAEQECLGPSLVNVRNVQRPADGRAKTLLVVTGFALRLAVQRIRLGVEPSAAVVEKNGAMRLVYIESAHASTTAP